MHVLLVEDDLVFAKSLEALLKRKCEPDFGFEHVDCLGGALMRLTIKGPDIDLILLDLTLPDSGGLDTVVQVRKKAFGIPIVVMTGRDDNAIGIEAVKAGAQDYLLKGALDGTTIIRSLQYAIERAKFLSDREDFVATLTHDLKNPLIGCDKLVTLLADGAISDVDEQRNLLHHIKASNRAVISLIDNLLEIYKYDKNLAELALEHTNLVRLANSCIEEWTPIASLQGMELHRINETDSVPIVADTKCIKRVLQNLIDNAIKYSTTGSIITVNVFADDTKATLEVSNPCKYLREEDLKHMFNRFWRADANKTRTAGTGLGLYLCRQLVELHEGTIDCRKSEDGINTVFTVELPRSLSPSLVN